MKFYEAYDERESMIDCFLTLRKAKAAVRERGDVGRVDMVEVPVNAESVRLLLAGQGGYAVESKTVWEAK